MFLKVQRSEVPSTCLKGLGSQHRNTATREGAPFTDQFPNSLLLAAGSLIQNKHTTQNANTPTFVSWLMSAIQSPRDLRQSQLRHCQALWDLPEHPYGLRKAVAVSEQIQKIILHPPQPDTSSVNGLKHHYSTLSILWASEASLGAF